MRRPRQAQQAQTCGLGARRRPAAAGAVRGAAGRIFDGRRRTAMQPPTSSQTLVGVPPPQPRASVARAAPNRPASFAWAKLGSVKFYVNKPPGCDPASEGGGGGEGEAP
jgi:hypothetical protein